MAENDLDVFLGELHAAANGLLYPSETDAEIVPVVLSPPFPWESAPDCEEVEFDAFFRELRSQPDAAGFHLLHQLLFSHLTDLRVHRVGVIRVQVFVTGLWRASPTVRRVGLQTLSVET